MSLAEMSFHDVEPYLLLGVLISIFAFLGFMIKLEQWNRERQAAKDQPRWDRITEAEDELRVLRKRKLELQIAILEARLDRLRNRGS